MKARLKAAASLAFPVGAVEQIGAQSILASQSQDDVAIGGDEEQSVVARVLFEGVQIGLDPCCGLLVVRRADAGIVKDRFQPGDRLGHQGTAGED